MEIYNDGNITLHHGDARKLFAPAPNIVIVTDPPYGISYTQQAKNLGGKAYKKIAGDNDTELVEWVLSLGAPTVVFGAHEFHHLLPAGGRLFCWDKRVNDNADRMLGHNFELAWGNIPGKKHRMIRVMHGGVVNADGPGPRFHPTQKPVEVMRRILLECDPGLTVVDLFAGSGSTLLAAKSLGRKALGIEVDEEYCRTAAKRLEDF